MRLADVVEIDKDGFITIPPELRCLVGFEDDASVYFSLIRSEYYHWKEPKRKKFELKPLIASIDPRLWSELYDLEFRLGDEPGSLAALTDILGKHGISIQVGESRTVLYNVRAELSITAHFKDFEGSIEDLNNIIGEEIRRNSELKKSIKPILRPVIREEKEAKVIGFTTSESQTEVVEIVERWVNGKPSPLQYYAFDREFPKGIAGKSGRDNRILLARDEEVATIEDGIVQIPKAIIKELDRHFGLPNERYHSVAGSCCTIIVADSDIKILTLTLPPPWAKIVQIQFYQEDEPGAIAELAKFLSKNGIRINLLETRIRTLDFAKLGMWRIIADLSKSSYRGHHKIDLATAIEKDIEAEAKKARSYLKGEIKILKAFGEPKEGNKGKLYGIAYEALYDFENEFRDFIERSLQKKCGENWWKEAVPKDIRDKVEERIKKEERQYPWYDPEDRVPVAYIAFVDYVKIIEKKDNWERAFKSVFSDKDYVTARLKSIEPIRNKIAHATEINKDEFKRFTIYSEDLLSAIRKKGNERA